MKHVYVHENCKFLIFKFSKVMQQHTEGVVGSVIPVLLEIYCSLQQCKKFAILPRIDKVIAMVRVAPFLTHGVFLPCVSCYYLISSFFFLA